MSISPTGAAEAGTLDHDPVAHGHQGPVYKMAIARFYSVINSTLDVLMSLSTS